MGQIKVLHEHYYRAPWASMLAGFLIAGLAIFKLFGEEITTESVITFSLTAIPLLLILVLSIIRRNKPVLVIYNDRIEVNVSSSKYSRRVNEIMYSDIKNLTMESGQLLIWLDEASVPMYCNMGANAKYSQETYEILRSSYDKYNKEHNITPARIENLPKRNKVLIMAIAILIMTAIMILIFMLRKYY